MNKRPSLEDRLKSVKTVEEFNSLEPETGMSIEVSKSGHSLLKISAKLLLLPSIEHSPRSA